jgi:anti-sigma B factor antagonist
VETDFAIELSGGHTWARIAVAGELDLCTAPELREALEREHDAHRPTTVDLSAVTFIDSTGIMTLLNACRDAQENAWDLGIASPLSEAVTRTARVAGVLALLPLVEE